MAISQQYCIWCMLNILNYSEVGSTLNLHLAYMNVEEVLWQCYKLMLGILTSHKHCLNIRFLLQICQYHGYFATILHKIFVEYLKLRLGWLNIEFSSLILQSNGKIAAMFTSYLNIDTILIQHWFQSSTSRQHKNIDATLHW